MKTAMVIPCFKVKEHISEVLSAIPHFVDYVILVDDCCPVNSLETVRSSYTSSKYVYLKNSVNQGVGGAMKTGFIKAIELQVDIVVKVDGDNQMDLSYCQALIEPIINGKADYVKGNRFKHIKQLKSMPVNRLIGNSALSFLLKVASGYWDVMDPTNGYFAISSPTLQALDFSKLANRYFFESDMLIHLNMANAVVKDLPIPAKYGNESSSLSIWKVLLTFPLRIAKGLFKRIFYKYFLFDFNMASVYLIIGLPLFFWGLFFGLYKWFVALQTDIPTPTGTIMLVVLPLLLGTQFLLQAVQIDIQSMPKRD